MKLAVTFLLAFVATFAHAQKLPAFAKTDRIVTVEQWGRNEAMVWAVQNDCVVVYKVFDGPTTDELLVEIPISKNQTEKIRKAVAAIPQGVRGRVHFSRGIMDGIMLRVSFTGNGRYANDRIEVQNLWLPWLGDTLQVISEVAPEALKIGFKEMVDESRRLSGTKVDWPVTSISIDEYYKVPSVALPALTAPIKHER